MADRSRAPVLLVEYRSGETVYDPYREGASLPVPVAPFPDLWEPPLERCAARDWEQALAWVERRWRPGSVLVNADHLVSFAGLRAWAMRPPARRGLIVVDQHLDAYSLEHTQSALNKANFLRAALESGWIEALACVGVRAAEVALFEGRPELVPELHRPYVTREHRAGVFGGLGDRVRLYPAAQYDLDAGLGAALGELADRGVEELGLDLDLDAFDSGRIVGVDYNPDWSRRALDFVAGRIAAKRIAPALEDWLVVLANIAFTRWEIGQVGLDPAGAGSAVARLLTAADQRGLATPFRAISEFEPAYDDGRSAELVGVLSAALGER